MQNAKICWAVDAGLIRYAAACELQRELVAARKAGAIPDVLLLCEHPHVITLGRNGKRENLLAGNRLLAQMNVEFHPTDRGGDITYHGPGQVVGYPILDLAEHRRDVRWYVEQLEETMIRASAEYGVRAKRVEGRHGIWVDAPAEDAEKSGIGPQGLKPLKKTQPIMSELKLRPPNRIFSANCAGDEKLGAIGVHLSRWVTSHGFAYNVSTDLRFFDLIVPCGISGRRATSLERLLGHAIDKAGARERLTSHFGEVFQCELIQVPLENVKRAIERSGSYEGRHDSMSMETEILNGSRV